MKSSSDATSDMESNHEHIYKFSSLEKPAKNERIF
jgi:hypothetical protein